MCCLFLFRFIPSGVVPVWKGSGGTPGNRFLETDSEVYRVYLDNSITFYGATHGYIYVRKDETQKILEDSNIEIVVNRARLIDTV